MSRFSGTSGRNRSAEQQQLLHLRSIPSFLLVLLFQEVIRASSAPAGQPIWLIGIQPFTGGSWDAGISMRFAGDLMLEEINKHPTLLPGYDLRFVWQDGQCNGDVGGPLFMENLFKHQYHVFAPGVAVGDMDADGDGVIEPSDVAAMNQNWNDSQVYPPPVGVLSGCSGGTSKMVPLAFYSNLPIISCGASFGALSIREKYPNFYRTILPDTMLQKAYLAVVKLFGHRSIMGVAATDETANLVMSYFAEQAEEFGVELMGTDYSETIPGFRGVRVSAKSPDSIRDAVRVFIQWRSRFIALLIFLDEMRALMCEGYKQGFFNAVYFVYGWSSAGWWRSPAPECSVESIMYMTRSFIAASMVHWRLEKDMPLTCSANMTVQVFAEEYFRRQGVGLDELGMTSDGYSVYGDGALMADAICMFAVMLHEVLFVRKISFNNLIGRTPETYTAMQEILTATDFEGLFGRVRFEPGSSDPSAAVKVEQLQNDTLVELARYLHPNFIFLGRGNFTFHYPGESVLAGPLGATHVSLNLSQYKECGDLMLDFKNNSCTACPENTEFVQVASACLCIKGFHRNESGGCAPCQAGRFSNSVGSVACTLCEPGRSSTPASTSCSFCARGTFSSSSGSSECEQCPAFQTTRDIASMSSSACICTQGSFGTPASSGCFACPANATTLDMGASTASQCRCMDGTFMSIAFDSCIACPAGSDTNSDGKVSLASCLCAEGTYMPRDVSKGCQDCPPNMVCPKGSNVVNDKYLDLDVRGEEQQFMELQSRFWSSREEPLSLFKCRSRENCIGGVPGKACGEKLVGRVCERCITGYYWNGERCKECVAVQRSYFLYPVLPVMLSPVGTLVFYLCSGDGFATWGTWWYAAAALVFVTLNTYQILGGILSSVTLALPKMLIAVFGYYSTTNDVTAGLSVDCVQLMDLVPIMAAKTVYPVIIVGACGVNYVVSRLAARLLHRQWLRMEPNRLVGVIGSIMFTFFGAVASMSLVLFKCSGNPNGLYTLAVDLRVICFTSHEWLSGLGIGITCVLLYIFGFGSVVGYVLYKAPEKIRNPGFQVRWQFLFNKFHCSAYWWGLVFLAKNFLFNLVPVVAPHEFSQLYLSMTVAVFYVAWATAVRPYRSRLVNLIEVLAGVCIVYTVSLLTWYADVQGRAEFDGRVAMASVFITALPGIAFPGVLCFLAIKGWTEQNEAANTEAERQFVDWKRTLWAFSRIENDKGQCILLSMGEAERKCICQAVFLINTDVFGFATRRRICGNDPLEKLRESCANVKIQPLDQYPCVDKEGIVTEVI